MDKKERRRDDTRDQMELAKGVLAGVRHIAERVSSANAGQSAVLSRLWVHLAEAADCMDQFCRMRDAM